LREVKVDARCIVDRLESIEHAVNIAPIKLHNLASEVQNCSARITCMERKMTALEVYLKEIKEIVAKGNNEKDTNMVSAPLKKKTKMVSYDEIAKITYIIIFDISYFT